jgi:succinate dehydrogenase / fumarate reductase flavoprotein subunit
MRVQTFAADAVILASGGPGQIYRQEHATPWSTPARIVSSVFQQGAAYGNPEMIQIHPTAIPGERQAAPDERERARRGRSGLGAEEEGRQPRPQGDPRGRALVLLEGEVPQASSNLVPRDVASREIYQAAVRPGDGRGRQA